MARTVVNLDDRMVLEAMRLTGLRRKVDVVNEGLRVLVAQRRLQRGFDRLRGRVAWDGDLDQMRHGR
jgi:Arc/MetJ family transcription regulator